MHREKSVCVSGQSVILAQEKFCSHPAYLHCDALALIIFSVRGRQTSRKLLQSQAVVAKSALKCLEKLWFEDLQKAGEVLAEPFWCFGTGLCFFPAVRLQLHCLTSVGILQLVRKQCCILLQTILVVNANEHLGDFCISIIQLTSIFNLR